MRKIILLLIVVMGSLGIAQAKTLYSCFLSQDLNMNTSEVSNQISDNSLIDIYVDV